MNEVNCCLKVTKKKKSEKRGFEGTNDTCVGAKMSSQGGILTNGKIT